MPSGSSPLTGSSNMQHRRVAEQRGGDAEPLAHAERETADPPRATASSPTSPSTSSTRAAGDAVGCAPAHQQVVAGACGRRAGPSRRAARRPRAAARQLAVAAAADRARAGGRPVEAEIIRIVVDLPGAVRAEESGDPPGRTVKLRSSTASVSPYRLVSRPLDHLSVRSLVVMFRGSPVPVAAEIHRTVDALMIMLMEDHLAPLYLLAGIPGSGKTTLLPHLLRAASGLVVMDTDELLEDGTLLGVPIAVRKPRPCGPRTTGCGHIS